MIRKVLALTFTLPVIAVTATACSSPPAATTTSTGANVVARTWSTPAQFGPAGSSQPSLYGVSCPKVGFCVAVDGEGNAYGWQGGRWSPPQAVPLGGTLTSVSCSTAFSCVTTGVGGESSTVDGTTWSAAEPLGPPATYRVSCPTADFCAAVGASGTVGAPSTVRTYDGHSWSPAEIPPAINQVLSGSTVQADRLMDVSCATQDFCVAVNLDGRLLSFNGARWSLTAVRGLARATSVSCPSTSFCMVVGPGTFSTFGGRKWSTPTSVPGLDATVIPSVSCGTSHTCTAIGLIGMALSWRNGRWSSPVRVFPGVVPTVEVSCQGTGFCMAVNGNGTASHT